MSSPQISGLLTQLHEKFTSSATSPEQDALMQQLHSQLTGPLLPDGNVVVTAEMLLAELEEDHPHLTGVVRELITALGRIGI